jgi:hypothetical protein
MAYNPHATVAYKFYVAADLPGERQNVPVNTPSFASGRIRGLKQERRAFANITTLSPTIRPPWLK